LSKLLCVLWVLWEIETLSRVVAVSHFEILFPTKPQSPLRIVKITLCSLRLCGKSRHYPGSPKFSLHLNINYLTCFLNFRRSILQLLLVRESESKLVSRLFVFEFFQGASIALFFTTAISLFIDHLPTSELPKVFILSALLLWATGFLYSKLEHSLSSRQLIFGVLGFNALCIVLFRVFIYKQEESWFLFLFLSMFNVLYLLNNLEFWGVVARLFDVRQSKRLFAIVSAGDIPAKLIGYIIALLLVPYIGTENLLWIAAGCVIISSLLFFPISKLVGMKEWSPVQHKEYATENIQGMRASLTGNRLIRTVAFVSFFYFCFFIIVTFIFYGYIKKEFQTDKALAGFFAVFMATSRGITLLIKLLGTNRLIDKLGIRKSLLITPLFLLLVCLVTILFANGGSSHTTFYMFGIMAISADILRSAIQTPVLLATLQPLPVHHRLRGHTIIKGFMDPFAFLAIGVLLLLLEAFDQMSFSLLTIILMGITILWLFFTLSVDKNYIAMLTAAIRKRSLNERDISITDTDSLNFLSNRLKQGTEEDALSVLRLVSSQPVERKIFYRQALYHVSANVRRLSLQYIQTEKDPALLPDLKSFLQTEKDPVTLAHLIFTIALLDKTEDVSPFLDNPNPVVANAAAITILKEENSGSRDKAEEYSARLFLSSAVDDKLNALTIAGELKTEQYTDHILQLMSDSTESVWRLSATVAGKIGGRKLITRLLTDFLRSPNDAYLADAIIEAGESSLPYIHSFLQNNQCSEQKRKRLFVVIGKIKCAMASDLLQEYLVYYPQDEYVLLSSLHQLNFRSTANHDRYKNLIAQNLRKATDLIFQLNISSAEHHYTLINRALELELGRLREKCLCLFSFLYDEEKIKKIKSGFELNTKESLANTFELVEMTIPKEFSSIFTIVFEKNDYAFTARQLRKFYKESGNSISAVANNVLADPTGTYHDWTKACVLYTGKNQPLLLKTETVAPYLQSENMLIREIAELVASKP
jgi:AAA family ATP:ADP antiporter